MPGEWVWRRRLGKKKLLSVSFLPKSNISLKTQYLQKFEATTKNNNFFWSPPVVQKTPGARGGGGGDWGGWAAGAQAPAKAKPRAKIHGLLESRRLGLWPVRGAGGEEGREGGGEGEEGQGRGRRGGEGRGEEGGGRGDPTFNIWIVLVGFQQLYMLVFPFGDSNMSP